jgi:hypothetical protein
MSTSGLSTEGTDWLSHGVQAVARKGYGFLLDDECNFCTRRKIFEAYGHNTTFPSRDKEGVEVIVRGVPIMWFDVVPERCTCDL